MIIYVNITGVHGMLEFSMSNTSNTLERQKCKGHLAGKYHPVQMFMSYNLILFQYFV